MFLCLCHRLRCELTLLAWDSNPIVLTFWTCLNEHLALTVRFHSLTRLILLAKELTVFMDELSRLLLDWGTHPLLSARHHRGWRSWHSYHACRRFLHLF